MCTANARTFTTIHAKVDGSLTVAPASDEHTRSATEISSMPFIGVWAGARAVHTHTVFDGNVSDKQLHTTTAFDNLTLTSIPHSHASYTTECVKYGIFSCVQTSQRSCSMFGMHDNTKLHVRVCHSSQMKRSFLILYGNCNSASSDVQDTRPVTR